MSSFQGVAIEEFHCLQRCPHFRVLGSTVYRSVSFQGVRIEGVHYIGLN